MKNRIALRLLIGLALMAGLLAAARSALAQKGARVTIPFAFEANNTVLPAGDYQVRVLTSHLIEFIDSSNGTYKALLLVRPQQEVQLETRGRMVFLRSEKQNILSQIRFQGSNLHANLLINPSLRRELAKRTLPGDATVEISMR